MSGVADGSKRQGLVGQRREIEKTGISDTGKLGQYAQMLRAAKQALLTSLAESRGLLMEDAVEVIEDLQQVTPLASPTKERELLSGEYACVSCELPLSRWGDTVPVDRLERELEFVGAAAQVGGGDAAVRLLGGTYTLTGDTLERALTVGTPAGEEVVLKIRGGYRAEGPTKLDVDFEFGERSAEVIYLDQDLLILRDEGEARAHVVVLSKKKKA